jgi:hypothetical protein
MSVTGAKQTRRGFAGWKPSRACETLRTDAGGPGKPAISGSDPSRERGLEARAEAVPQGIARREALHREVRPLSTHAPQGVALGAEPAAPQAL